MRIAICDDSREDAAVLTSLLTSHQLHVFSSPDALLTDLEKNGNRYDLFLLDIYMETTLNGIDLGRRLREMDDDAAICFISSCDDFYREAYDLQDVNYLLKPVNGESLSKLIERVERRRQRSRDRSFSYKWNGHPETVAYSNILFISSNGHNAGITCKDGRVRPIFAKLDDIEPLLDGKVFMRCHQSFLVNLYQVDNLSGTDLLVAGHTVPISRKYYADIKRRYQEILFEEVT